MEPRKQSQQEVSGNQWDSRSDASKGAVNK